MADVERRLVAIFAADVEGYSRLMDRELNPALRVSNLKDVVDPFGVPKTSRDTKKHCGEPGCPNDHRGQCSPVATRIE